MNSKRTLVQAGAVVIGLGSLALARSATPDAGPAPAAAAAPRPSTIAGPGRVEPISEEIDVAAEISGTLARVLVDEGDAVGQGQPIARIEDRDYRARVHSAQARLAVARAERDRVINGARPEERRQAEAVRQQADAARAHARIEVERSRRLFAEGVIAREALDRAERDWQMAQARSAETTAHAEVVDAEARADERSRAEAAVRLAEAQLEEAEALLAKTTVRAPLAGTVLRRHRLTGESVSTDSPAPAIVTLADTSVLRVRVEVDEKDIAGVAPGQPAWVTADAYGDRRFAGRVVRIGSMLGRKHVRTDEPSERVDTKVLEVLVELDRGVMLPIGLRVDAFIQ